MYYAHVYAYVCASFPLYICVHVYAYIHVYACKPALHAHQREEEYIAWSLYILWLLVSFLTRKHTSLQKNMYLCTVPKKHVCMYTCISPPKNIYVRSMYVCVCVIL